MTRFFFPLILAAALMVPATFSNACGIEGSATREGEPDEATSLVTTSFNSDYAVPRGGTYTLELGDSACGTSVEVFVNSFSIGQYMIPSSGNAKVDFKLRGLSSRPFL
jgi:hypothetical protein